MALQSKEEISGIPTDLMGLWGFWDVRDHVTSDFGIDSQELNSIKGLFLGFGSGDRNEWARILPELKNIEYLVSWTGHNPQNLFDAITRMTWLKRLCFGRLAARDISALRNLEGLQYLCMHQLRGTQSIEPITELQSLRVLEMGLSPKITSLDAFSVNRLRSLRSLILYANRPRIDVPSLRPLAAIPSLQYLSVPTVRPDDLDLGCLAGLSNLKFVHLSAKWWPADQVQALKETGVAVRQGFQQ